MNFNDFRSFLKPDSHRENCKRLEAFKAGIDKGSRPVAYIGITLLAVSAGLHLVHEQPIHQMKARIFLHLMIVGL